MEQRISLVTLGVADLDRSRAFYERGLGWSPRVLAEGVAFYQVGGLVVSLFVLEGLRADAGLPDLGQGRGAIALAHNVDSPEAVRAVLAEADAAGGRIDTPGQETGWGGYAGYFSDPDGHLWEVAWNPHWPMAEDGGLYLPEA